VKEFFDPAYWSRAVRDPVVLVGLAVDLAPVFAVIAWHWGAAPLVMLYWMENLVIGVMTVPRMLFISIAKFGPIGFVGGLFMSAFFTVHYGMFCFVHGGFITAFLATSHPELVGPNFMPFDFGSMIGAGLASGPNMVFVLALIIFFQLFAFLFGFLLRGEWKRSGVDQEMLAPYGRIIILHIGIFAGAFALIALGDPMVGVLALIVLRALWGVRVNVKASDGPSKPVKDPALFSALQAAQAKASKPDPKV
jgi:hypothetical protein